MRYLVFSDLHFFRGRDYLLDTCRWIAEQIKLLGPDIVVFGGDLNHAHDYVQTPVLHSISAGMAEIADATKDYSSNLVLYALSGNHDTSLRSTDKNIVDSISYLHKDIWAVTKPMALNSSAIMLPSPPHGDEDAMAEYKAKMDALVASKSPYLAFGHLELANVRYTPVAPNCSDHPLELPGCVKTIVNGHYHHPDSLDVGGKRIILVGSPCYHTYSDVMVEIDRGILLLTDDNGVIKEERIANPHGPIYHTVDAALTESLMTLPADKLKRLKVRIRVKDKADYNFHFDAIQRLRDKVDSVRVVGKTSDVASEIHKLESETIESVDPLSMFKSYVTKRAISKEIADCGQEILSGLVQ